MGWVIECSGRGYSSCPNSGNSSALNDDVNDNHADGYDLAVGNDLIQIAESNIANGNTNGSYTVTKQINGQNFARVYTVNWNSTPTTCNEESANPSSTTISVDVIYVTL